jgi:hypothetical protein
MTRTQRAELVGLAFDAVQVLEDPTSLSSAFAPRFVPNSDKTVLALNRFSPSPMLALLEPVFTTAPARNDATTHRIVDWFNLGWPKGACQVSRHARLRPLSAPRFST